MLTEYITKEKGCDTNDAECIKDILNEASSTMGRPVDWDCVNFSSFEIYTIDEFKKAYTMSDFFGKDGDEYDIEDNQIIRKALENDTLSEEYTDNSWLGSCSDCDAWYCPETNHIIVYVRSFQGGNIFIDNWA